jgi:hypothetical protein
MSIGPRGHFRVRFPQEIATYSRSPALARQIDPEGKFPPSLGASDNNELRGQSAKQAPKQWPRASDISSRS